MKKVSKLHLMNITVFLSYRVILLLFVTFVLVTGLKFPATAREIIDLGKVKPYVRQQYIIAIPGFDAMDPATRATQFQPSFFPSVIYRDLELSGYFRRPENQKFVEENHRRDEQLGKIDFMEWTRLKASFLLKGKFRIAENNIIAEVILYDTASGQRVFGNRYSYPYNQARALAHQIADDIMRYVVQIKGIANTRIVFVSTRTGKPELFIMDADGANQRQLTRDNSLVATPCWGARGAEIYFTSYVNFNPDLYGITPDGTRRWLISALPGFNLSPHWSEAKQLIALTLGKDGNSEIYTMGRDGKGLKRLTINRAIDSSPCWSPDGEKIIFTSDRIGYPQIFVMDSNGGGQKRLTFQGSYNDGARWSPKGDKIAFTARRGGVFDIFLMNADGTNWVALTANQGNNEDPCWAPDGEHLAFVSDRTGKAQIFVMCIDGSNQTQLTFEGSNYSPDWSPYF